MRIDVIYSGRSDNDRNTPRGAMRNSPEKALAIYAACVAVARLGRFPEFETVGVEINGKIYDQSLATLSTLDPVNAIIIDD